MYATKPVFNLFTAGSERRKGITPKRERGGTFGGEREGGREILGERTKTAKNNSRNMFQIRQVQVNDSKHILGETNS